MSDEPTVRPGTTADLSRRMDRIEHRQDETEKAVRSLEATVARVEVNQLHAVELSKLRFDALDSGLRAVELQLSDFIRRVEGMVTGEVETQQAREGRALVADYKLWRGEVDDFMSRGRLLASISVLLVTSNVLAWAAAIYAVTSK